MRNPDILTALEPLLIALEKLSIRYYIGGSVASSMFGMARTTLDLDIVADIREYHVERLANLLNSEYYIDKTMINDAIHRTASFNIIHLPTAFKIDIFLPKTTAYQEIAIERRVKDRFFDECDFDCYFSSPEDVILAKLQWYLQGNQLSEKQWLDILGIIKVQKTRLDTRYLQVWATNLGVLHLLEKAFSDCDVQLND